MYQGQRLQTQLLTCAQGVYAKVTKSEEWITNTTLTSGQHLTAAQFLQAFDGSHLAISHSEPHQELLWG